MHSVLKLMFLEPTLRGKALGILSGMPSDCNRDPDKIFGELRKHLEVHSTRISATNAFTTKRKKPNETIPEYANDLKKIGLQACGDMNPDSFETLLMSQFLRGLPDPVMSRILSMAQAKSLDDLVTKAVEYETYGKSEESKPHKPMLAAVEVSSNVPPKSDNKPIQELANRIEQMAQRLDILTGYGYGQQYSYNTPSYWSGIPRSPPRRGVCYLCRRHGHVRRDCPQRWCMQCKQTGHSRHECPQAGNNAQSGDGSGMANLNSPPRQ